MTSLLQVTELDVTIGRSQVLHDVSLSVEPGESLGIIGETGSGKTMTLRAITGLLPAVGGEVTSGTITVDGVDVTHTSLRARLRAQPGMISLVPQASMSSLDPLQPIGSQVREALGLNRSETVSADDVERALLAVRLTPTRELLAARPYELSGGMRQRVMIALALAPRPRLLLADEPTTALDASVRASVLDLLAEHRRSQGLGLVIISHDINAIASSTDRVVVMHDGRMVESGPTSRILDDPQHPYTRMLVAALPERTAPGHFLPVHQSGEKIVADSAPVRVPGRARPSGVVSTVEADKLDFAYADRKILHDISIRVRAGERVGIVGESGSGKSTLARLLAGILPSPSVTIDGKPWRAFGSRQPERHEVQLVLQDPFSSLTPTRSALSTVEEACRVVQGLSKRDATARAVELLAAVGLSGDLVHRRPRGLSGGQCQRVSIARALAADPSILIADEPTSALDLSVQAGIVNLLLTLTTERPLGLVIVSHDLAVIRHLSDRVVVLKDGHIVEKGPTETIFERPQHTYTRALLDANPWIAVDQAEPAPSAPRTQSTLVAAEA